MSEDAPGPGHVYERLQPVQASELKARVRTPAVPVDRLDAFLSGQTGWRLAVLVLLQVCLPTGMLCVGLWSLFLLGSISPLWLIAATALLAGLLVVAVLRRVGRRDQRLVVSWRLMAGELCILATVVFDAFSTNEPSWQHAHRATALASAVMAVIGSLLIVDAARQQRKAAGRQAH
jgi:hypothetical protein